MAESKMTRRQLGAVIAAAVPAAMAQTATDPNSKDDATVAREILKRNSDAIARFDLPVATEPSFVFKP